MKIDARHVLCHPNGIPLMLVPDEKDEEGNVTKPGQPMMVGLALMHVALQPSTAQEPYTSREQVLRYTLGLNAWNAMKNEEDPTLVVTHDMILAVEDDLNRILSPVAGGQLLVMMGYRLDDEVIEERLDIDRGQAARLLARLKK